ncbi:TIGR00730 family Rossman fold protein [Enterobacter chuandaensis]|uniref:LOG family protein n=1 Tax=Enterobacter chuandaensis TaxID=2497875 RepID=UPI002FD3425F
MKAIGIFCGSSEGSSSIYMKTANEVGEFLAKEGIRIVYGGGRVGLMGAVATSALEKGGYVTGVMPSYLVTKEIAHTGLSDLQIVQDMHHRKKRMAELSDGFIALPGGAGTLEEIFEQWTWGQLGIHQKPCAFLDVNGFYQPLKVMISKMVTEGFMKQSYADMLFFTDSTQAVIDFFNGYLPPASKWCTAHNAKVTR